MARCVRPREYWDATRDDRIDAIHTFAQQIWAYATLKRVTWLEEHRVAACRYPRGDAAPRELAAQAVDLLVNLHQRPHAPEALARHGLTELNLPVADFTPPTPEQLERGVAAVEQAIADGQKVAVHCGAGLGRTGTLLSCYLVKRGLGLDKAIARVRAVRPGSVETLQQEVAIRTYARQTGGGWVRLPAPLSAVWQLLDVIRAAYDD